MSYDEVFEIKRQAIHEEALKSARSGNDTNVSSRNIRRKEKKETFSEKLKRQYREHNLSTFNKIG